MSTSGREEILNISLQTVVDDDVDGNVAAALLSNRETYFELVEGFANFLASFSAEKEMRREMRASQQPLNIPIFH